MMKRGRKSAAAFETQAGRTIADLANVSRTARHEAPEHLTDEQQAIWRSLIDAAPAAMMPTEALPVLVELVKAVSRAGVIAYETNRFKAEWFGVDGGPERYERLQRMADREARLIASLSTKLRLTPQARIRPERAGVIEQDHRPGRRPWD
ncbi:hypothetical protein [Microbaculum marinum]|uniref:Phage terminase small subunit P27 family n=1 Tax=Microbaculum marinum TaxID=1764581 RepID=A0AAW9RIC6_9HYPH